MSVTLRDVKAGFKAGFRLEPRQGFSFINVRPHSTGIVYIDTDDPDGDMTTMAMTDEDMDEFILAYLAMREARNGNS